MVYQAKHKNFCRGFSIVELIVVLGIFSIIFSISASVYSSFKAHSNLEMAANGTVEAVRFAESSAQSGKGDSKWGVKIFSNKVVVFSGDSYAGRDQSLDQVLNFSGGITASGLSEVVFEKLTGVTSMTGTINLTNNTESKNINVNEKGTVTY